MGKDDGGDSEEKSEAKFDTERLAFEDIHRRYDQFQTGEHLPEPLGQFLNRHTRTESEEITIDTDETKFVPKAELRDAYNVWDADLPPSCS